jgi:hypothetical protein
MNTMHDIRPGELTLEDIERITRNAHRMRSEAIAELGTTLRSVVKRWIQNAMFCLRGSPVATP